MICGICAADCRDSGELHRHNCFEEIDRLRRATHDLVRDLERYPDKATAITMVFRQRFGRAVGL